MPDTKPADDTRATETTEAIERISAAPLNAPQVMSAICRLTKLRRPHPFDDASDAARTAKALAALDAGAAAWARGANLADAVAAMLESPDRQARLVQYIKLTWTEGAYAARKSLTAQEIEEAARGK